MKKVFLLIITLIMSLQMITGCATAKDTGIVTDNNQKSTAVQEKDIRELAYNQLDSRVKDIIAGTCKDSKLSIITLEEEMGNITDKSYIGKEVYLIEFHTILKQEPNNKIVYLSMDNHKLLGYGYVE